MRAEITKGAVAEIGGRVGRGSRRIERTCTAGLKELKKIVVYGGVNTIHIDLYLVAGLQVGAVIKKRIVDISSIGEPVIEDIKFLRQPRAVDVLDKLVVIPHSCRVPEIGNGADAGPAKTAFALEADRVEGHRHRHGRDRAVRLAAGRYRQVIFRTR